MDFDVKKSKDFFGSDITQKTLFNGRITVKQLILIIVVVIAVLIVLKLVTGTLKIIITAIIIVVALFRFGLISPAPLKDAGKKMAQDEIKSYSTKYINQSDNIRLSSDNKIEIKVEDKWVPIDKIESIMAPNPLTGDKLSISVDGEIYEVNDKYVVAMLKTFTDGNILHKLFGTFKD